MILGIAKLDGRLYNVSEDIPNDIDADVEERHEESESFVASISGK